MTIKPYTRKANYYETDQMGIIHHSNYIRWFEEARVDFMEQIGFGYNKAVERGIDFAVLEVHCEYKSMVHFGDIVNIQITLSELKNASMVVNYKISDAKSGEIRTLGKTRHCFYDGNNKCLVSLKKVMPELFELFNSSEFINEVEPSEY